MTAREPFFWQSIFTDEMTNTPNIPRAFISPHRYIQGQGITTHLGSFLSLVPCKTPAVIISAGGKKRFGDILKKSFDQYKIDYILETFEGECSYEEVERIASNLSCDRKPVDAIIGFGGGKCLDAAKSIAFRLGVPTVICPTTASTDAPCSSLSVMYAKDGTGPIASEFFPNSPSMVIVDTQIIADSPKRYLVAGMGDALATWYEAKTCYDNPTARSTVGTRITLAAMAIAEVCAKTIYENGCEAADAVELKIINEPLEKIIEANTLLSGVGFESGGLSIAHAVATGLTWIPILHQKYLHGELVGLGMIIHLIMNGNKEEAKKAATFMAKIGLPIVLEQISLDIEKDAAALKEAMGTAILSTLTNSAPFEVTPEGLFAALSESQKLCSDVVKSCGDKAYRLLHGL